MDERIKNMDFLNGAQGGIYGSNGAEFFGPNRKPGKVELAPCKCPKSANQRSVGVSPPHGAESGRDAHAPVKRRLGTYQRCARRDQRGGASSTLPAGAPSPSPYPGIFSIALRVSSAMMNFSGQPRRW